MRAAAGGAVLAILAACSTPTTEVAATDTSLAKAQAESLVSEAEAFAADAQRQIDQAAAAVAEAERVIAEQQAAAARAARAQRAARSATTVRPRANYSGSDVWSALARCESGGNWAINTGNGYYGGLQMDMSFWRSYGGPAFASRPDLASPEQQIAVAVRARDSGRGYRPWPTCARKLGLI